MKQYALQSASKICIIRNRFQKIRIILLFLLSSKQRVCADWWNHTWETWEMSGMEQGTWITKHLLSLSRYKSYIGFFPQIICPSTQIFLLSIFTVIITTVHFLSQIHLLLYFIDLSKGFRKYLSPFYTFLLQH